MTTQPSSSLSKESFLEKKIQMLDQRLTLVEKFIDLRFRKIKEGDDDGHSEDDYIDRSSSSRKTNKGSSKRSRRKRDSENESDSTDESPLRSNIIKSSLRETSAQSAGDSAKRQKPGPASSKVKKLEGLLQGKELKRCVVRVTRTDKITDPLSSSTPTPITTISASGRTRRTPKRFQDEVEEEKFNGRKTRSRESLKRTEQDEEDDDDSNDDGKSLVKIERPETPPAHIVDHYSDNDNEDGGGDDNYIEEGPPSPISVDHGEEEGGYFTFPNLHSPPRSVVAGSNVGKRKRENQFEKRKGKDETASFEVEDDGNDDDWNAQDEGAESGDGDDEIVKKTPRKSTASQKGRKTGSTNTSSVKKTGRKKGAYRKERINFGRRKKIKLELAELPSETITNADPSLKLCHLCNWHFKAEVYDSHLETHARERHLQCPQCGKSYFNQFILRKHMRVHEPEKYAKKCRLCSKPFLHSDKLLSHERYCVKKALEKNETVDPILIEDLKRRTKTDTNWIEEAISTGAKLAESGTDPEERKLCPHCNKNFKLSFYDKHVSTHTRAKNWSCKMCDKAYHYKQDLVRHVASEHMTNPTCELCEKTFEDRDEFRSHLTPCRRQARKSGLGLKIGRVTSVSDGKEEQVQMKKEQNQRQGNDGDGEKGNNVNEDDQEEEEMVMEIADIGGTSGGMVVEEVSEIYEANVTSSGNPLSPLPQQIRLGLVRSEESELNVDNEPVPDVQEIAESN